MCYYVNHHIHNHLMTFPPSHYTLPPYMGMLLLDHLNTRCKKEKSGAYCRFTQTCLFWYCCVTDIKEACAFLLSIHFSDYHIKSWPMDNEIDSNIWEESKSASFPKSNIKKGLETFLVVLELVSMVPNRANKDDIHITSYIFIFITSSFFIHNKEL